MRWLYRLLRIKKEPGAQEFYDKIELYGAQLKATSLMLHDEVERLRSLCAPRKPEELDKASESGDE